MPTLHPVIRLTSFLVIVLLLPQALPWQLYLMAVMLLACYFQQQGRYWRSAQSMLWRLRWLLLSLLLVYLLMPADADNMKVLMRISSWQVWQQALQQVLVICEIILAVNLLLQSSSRDELLQSIYWLVAPCAWLGFSRQRLTLRLLLVLEMVMPVRQLALRELSGKQNERYSIAAFARLAAQIFTNVLHHARTTETGSLTFSPAVPPLWVQWLLPLLLAVIIVLPWLAGR